MFRSLLRSPFLLLIALLLAAPAADAAVDVTDAILTVTIAHSSVNKDGFEVEFRVIGTNLNNGTITPPLVAVPSLAISLKKDGADLVFDKSYSSEMALDAAWPNGSYDLRVNNGNLQSTLAYTRPLVPDPAISQPDAGGVEPPGPVELLFTDCPACNQVGDSVVAELSDAMTLAVLAQETLTSTSDSWIPQDGGSDLVLPELSSFLASVTHTALRQTNTAATGDDSLFLLFSNQFVQSDEIDFTTGFHTPTGHVCLAANHPAPPAGCSLVNDPALQVLDTSGSFTTQVDGHDVDYSTSVASNGQITGSATGDLDDNVSQETGSASFKGKLKGKSGEVSSKLSFTLENSDQPAKVKVKITDLLSIPGDTIDTTQSSSGSIGASKIKETLMSSGPLPFPPLGWLLEFDVDESSEVQNASLVLEGGRSFPLSGSNKFKFASGESTLKLQSTDKGIRVDLKKLVLNDSVDPVAVTGGDVSTRILGQSAKATIP